MNKHFLTTQQLENAKIGTMKKMVATPIKTEQAFLTVNSLYDKLMLKHGGKPEM